MPLGFTSSECSMLGGGTVIFGISASFVAGYILKQTKKNLLLLRVVCFGSTVMLVAEIFVI